MTRRPGRPSPARTRRYSTVSRRSSHTTVPAKPPARTPRPPRPRIPPVATTAAVHRVVPASVAPSRRRAGALVDEDEASLLDVIDNLLNKGVVINADVLLALADVDLIYLRLSALLCAADRVLPR